MFVDLDKRDGVNETWHSRRERYTWYSNMKASNSFLAAMLRNWYNLDKAQSSLSKPTTTHTFHREA